MVRYGRLSSFKVIEIGRLSASKAYVRPPFYCNRMPIFYRFRDTIYWSKICIFAVFTHHSLVWSHRQGVPLGPMAWESLGYPVVQTARWYSHQRVTDGQTDRQTDRHAAYAHCGALAVKREKNWLLMTAAHVAVRSFARGRDDVLIELDHWLLDVSLLCQFATWTFRYHLRRSLPVSNLVICDYCKSVTTSANLFLYLIKEVY